MGSPNATLSSLLDVWTCQMRQCFWTSVCAKCDTGVATGRLSSYGLSLLGSFEECNVATVPLEALSSLAALRPKSKARHQLLEDSCRVIVTSGKSLSTCAPVRHSCLVSFAGNPPPPARPTSRNVKAKDRVPSRRPHRLEPKRGLQMSSWLNLWINLATESSSTSL